MRWNSCRLRLKKYVLAGAIGSILTAGIAWTNPVTSSQFTPTPTPHRKPLPTALPAASTATPAPAPAASTLLGLKPIKLKDVDNRTFIVNHRGRVCLVFETDEDSQELARKAGEAVYSFEGRHDFQMTVVVDLSNSIASWVHDLAVAEMRKNLDSEALKLTPYYAKNNNPNNPRKYMHVVPDFDHSIGPLLNWKPTDGHLRALIFGGNGREIIRWDNIEEADFPMVVSAIKKALDDLLNSRSQDLPTSTNGHTPTPSEE